MNIKQHNLFGFSIYGSYSIAKRIEFFARYDQLLANTISSDVNNWYYQNTGRGYISGLHYKAVKGVNLSLNYQGWQPDNKNVNFQHHILLCFEYKF